MYSTGSALFQFSCARQCLSFKFASSCSPRVCVPQLVQYRMGRECVAEATNNSPVVFVRYPCVDHLRRAPSCCSGEQIYGEYITTDAQHGHMHCAGRPLTSLSPCRDDEFPLVVFLVSANTVTYQTRTRSIFVQGSIHSCVAPFACLCHHREPFRPT